MDNDKLQQTQGLYHFGAFRLDAAERRLWCVDEPISLTPKQFDLLFYFVENAGRVAKKSELLDAVWTDTYIEEATLARNISWLRNKLSDCEDDKPLIETVSKLGYRFAAEVTRSENNGNSLIVEEQTVQHFRGEEVITMDDAFAERRGEAERGRRPERENTNLLPPNISSSRFLLAAIALVALAGSGFFLYWNIKNSVELPTESSADVTLNRNAVKGRPQIEIGSIVHLQNRYPNDGSYLDAWGAVWSNPQFAQVPTEIMFVSTHDNPNRDNGSGSWEIVSASGKSNGEPLEVGDRIHLKNMYPNAGYLDACGWVEHLRVFRNYSNQSGAVFTTRSPARDNGTGVWIIRSATELFGSPVLEGNSIAIESAFSINDKGIIRISGFLNVAGYVKDIPSFNDYDGASLVFTQNRSNGQPVIDIWTITTSKAALVSTQVSKLCIY